jgi:hypothetical protein
MKLRSIVVAAAFVSLLGGNPAAVHAQADFPPQRSEVWDVALGTAAKDLPKDFMQFHCGTNGGPPSLPLAAFSDFKKCRPESTGLREVYFEYDDEAEYWARALDEQALVRRYRGTQVYEYPAVTSFLFDDAGIVRGIRIVTDPRQDYRDRNEFWTLANFLKQRFGVDGWDCTDLPPAEGETPVGSYFIKKRCTKRTADQYFILQNRYLQKKGQTFIDPHTGKVLTNSFDSETRFEEYDATAVDITKLADSQNN